MPEKLVLILANSVRNAPNSCVAGKELTGNEGNYVIGPWIRPISGVGDGSLAPVQRWTDQERDVQVLDIVRMNVAPAAADALQPENWLHAGQPRWAVVGKATWGLVEAAKDDPADLWAFPFEPNDRVSAARIAATPPGYSLRLIKVPSITLRVWRDEHPMYGPRNHRRALFQHQGRNYDIAFTDPNIQARYHLQIPASGQPANSITITHPCFICLSLAHQAVQSSHFKLIASLIDPE